MTSLDEAAKQEGYILACCSTPKSALKSKPKRHVQSFSETFIRWIQYLLVALLLTFTVACFLGVDTLQRLTGDGLFRRKT